MEDTVAARIRTAGPTLMSQEQKRETVWPVVWAPSLSLREEFMQLRRRWVPRQFGGLTAQMAHTRDREIAYFMETAVESPRNVLQGHRIAPGPLDSSLQNPSLGMLTLHLSPSWLFLLLTWWSTQVQLGVTHEMKSEDTHTLANCKLGLIIPRLPAWARDGEG